MSSVVAPSPPAQPQAPPLHRADTDKTMHPPGAWTGGDGDSVNGDAEHSPIAAVGNTFANALTTAGSMAATYLPAGVVSQLANYAPGIVPQSTKGLDEVTKADPASDLDNSTDPRTQRAFNSLSGSGPNDSSLDKASPDSIIQPTQFASPTAISPVSAEQLPGKTNANASDPLNSISTTAVTGHSMSGSMTGTQAPPPSAVTTSTAPSRETSLPFGAVTGGSTDSGASKAVSNGDGAPSSTLSVKSGVVGAGPTSGQCGPFDLTAVSRELPPIPSSSSPISDGFTPTASELEKDDLNYLAPAIASRDKIHPTTGAAAKPVDTGVASKFTEGSTAHPTPASPITSQESGHSRSASGTSSLSAGGSPKRKVPLAKRIKGEAKIIKGRLTNDTAKVQEGREILNGEV